jgi:hypothetical protein
MATTALPRTQVPQLNRLQTFGIIAAVVGLALLGAVWFIGGAEGPTTFVHSYIFGFYYAMAFPLGCLGLLMVQHLTGGAWGVTVRRMLEAGALAMPIFFILSIPVILAVYNSYGLEHYVYHWADPEVVTPGGSAFDPIVAHKVPWMSPYWFAGRMLIYFAIWSGLALMLRRWSLEQDRGGDGEATQSKMRMLSGIGTALFVLTVTFFAFDVGMSLDAHWYSTMYGAHYMQNGGYTILAFLLLVLTQVRRTAIFEQYVPVKPIHDLGKLLLAFTVLWTYLSYGQYVIIWAGDVAEFTPWYIKRQEGGWIYIVLALMIFAFFTPFFMLLGRKPKRNLNYLAGVAALVLVMRFVDMSWIILPEFHDTLLGAALTWTNFAAPIGMLGIFLAIWAWNMQRASLLPLNAPQMDALAAAQGGHH